MNVLKKVKGIISGDENESFGLVSAAPALQKSKTAQYKAILNNPGKLCLANVISGEMARLVCLEFRSKISGSERAEYLDSRFGKFLPRLREITETCAGLGGVILKPYISASGIEITCVTPDNFIPTEIGNDGQVLGGAFIDRITRGGKVYTRVEAHSFRGNEYVIENRCYLSDRLGNCGREIPPATVREWKNIRPRVTATGITKPLFAYFKIPTASCELPLGEAVFDRSIKLIADAEAQYERLLWEFESGERALYVDDAAIRQKPDGKGELPDKRLYRMINQENLFSDWTPELRDASILNGLDEILRRIEFNSGLAYGTLSRIQQSDKTAEEVRASKQRSYARVCEIQSSLKFALLDLIYAMDVLCDLYELAPRGKYCVSFEFDDSIVADRRCEFDERIKMFEAGIITKEEIRNWYFGEETRQIRDGEISV